MRVCDIFSVRKLAKTVVLFRFSKSCQRLVSVGFVKKIRGNSRCNFLSYPEELIPRPPVFHCTLWSDAWWCHCMLFTLRPLLCNDSTKLLLGRHFVRCRWWKDDLLRWPTWRQFMQHSAICSLAIITVWIKHKLTVLRLYYSMQKFMFFFLTELRILTINLVINRWKLFND